MIIRAAKSFKLLLTLTFIVCTVPGAARAASLFDGRSLQPVELSAVTAQVLPGSVLIISERHDLLAHHQNQLTALEELARTHQAVSVGFEFFDFTNQGYVDEFTAGRLLEQDFLSAIAWSRGNPFEFYRPLVHFPAAHSGETVALNAPRSLTSKVSRQGLASLTDEERALLPPDFSLGNSAYRERFEEVMGGHVPAEAVDRYFAAQSIWDDVMAFVAARYLDRNPEQVLVIIVGDFHAIYGGGLPDRLRARGVDDVTVISQVESEGAASEVIGPHPRWGVRADYVWVTP